MVDPGTEFEPWATRVEAAPTIREALERLHPECFHWALALTRGDRTEAEEVLQVSYLRILSGRARFEGRSKLRTWVFGVVRRVAAERRRRAAVRRLARLRWLRPAEIESAPGPEERAASSRRAARTRRALARLSPRQREVVTLVFYQELTLAEVAEVVGISAGSARTHYERGKARLRVLLAEEKR